MTILSSGSKEGIIRLLNIYFYSTTYSINDKNQVTWKNGEVKNDLELVITKNRYQIKQI